MVGNFCQSSSSSSPNDNNFVLLICFFFSFFSLSFFLEESLSCFFEEILRSDFVSLEPLLGFLNRILPPLSPVQVKKVALDENSNKKTNLTFT